MTETLRIILSMSDVELLKFYGIGGRIPVSCKSRVARMLDGFAPAPMDIERERTGWHQRENTERVQRERLMARLTMRRLRAKARQAA